MTPADASDTVPTFDPHEEGMMRNALTMLTMVFARMPGFQTPK